MLILYRLSITIFPIISFNLNSALAIVTERFFACICMLAGFFNLADSCATPINICVSQIALKKVVVKGCHSFILRIFFPLCNNSKLFQSPLSRILM